MASPSSNEVKAICNRALELMRQGNPTKANHILKDARRRYDSSPLFHQVRADIHICIANSINDPKARHSRYQEALDSARRATTLSPSTLEFSLTYTQLLLRQNTDSIQEASAELERVLSAPNPSDFIYEMSTDPTEQNHQRTTARIALFKEMLQFFLKTLKNPDLSASYKKSLVNVSEIMLTRSYLKWLTPPEWSQLLKIDVREFQKCPLFPDALECAKANHSWKFFSCPSCHDRNFGDPESHLQHVLGVHLVKLSNKLKQLLPKAVNHEWVDKLLNCDAWEPIDVILSQENSNPDEWALSNDAQRKMLLLRVQTMIHMLFNYKYLAMSHSKKLIRLAMDGVEAHPSSSFLLTREVNDQSALCFRVLDPPQLQKVVGFLQSLSRACKLGRNREKDSDVRVVDIPQSDVRLRVFLDHNLSNIELDFSPLVENPTGYLDDGIRCVPDIDSVLYWLYEPQDFKEISAAWITQTEERTDEANKIFRMLEKNAQDLDTMCEEKQEPFIYQNKLQYLKDKCKREVAKTGDSLEFIMWEYQEKLLAEKGDEFMIKVISDIAEDAETSNSSIEATCQKLEESLDLKLCLIDAKIMQNLEQRRQLELDLPIACRIDYLTLLVPHLRTYLQLLIKEKIELVGKKDEAGSTAARLDSLLPKELESNLKITEDRPKGGGKRN